MGVVFYGIPGTGKTATISTLIKKMEGKVTFANVRGGGTGDLGGLYRWISRLGPAVLIVEDFDAIGATRGNASTAPMLSVLLNVLDGDEKHDVVTIATTNYPERLDRALIRPGRLGLSVEFNAPGEELRRSIIAAYREIYKIELPLEVLMEYLDREGVLGCHVKEICETVMVEALQGGDPLEALRDAVSDFLGDDNLHWQDTERETTICGFGHNRAKG